MISILPDKKKCIISISFLNYLSAVGGMSKYMMAHEKMYTAAGYSYISIYSVKKIVKGKYPLFYFYGLNICGENVGVFSLDELMGYLSSLTDKGYTINDVHIHNISYMNIEHLMRFSDTVPDTPFKLILHDFHTICSNFNLLKNGTDYCGDEVMSDQHCEGCRYYSVSKPYIQRVRKLIYHVKDRLEVVAPSKVAKDIWLRSYPEFQNQTIVITEQLWDGKYDGNRGSLNPEKKITIGYLGNKSPHKGWDSWCKFEKKSLKGKFDFLVFNSACEIPTDSNMRHIPVSFSKNNLNAMIDEIRHNNVDCVLLWSIWPETYSYTLFEALASNVFILTNKNSGNIAYVVKERGCGLVLSSEEELYEFAMHPEKLIERINWSRRESEPGPNNLIDNSDFLRLTTENGSTLVDYKSSNICYRIFQKLLCQTVIGFSKLLGVQIN